MFCFQIWITKTRPPFDPPTNLTMTSSSRVSRFTQSGVVMEDGQEIDVDAVIFCTGYHVEFPVLDDTCAVESIGGVSVYPVYRSFVHAEHPTLFFNNLFWAAPIWLTIRMAAQAAVNVLLGKAQLPSCAEMKAEIDGEIIKYRKAKRPLKLMSFIFYLDGSFGKVYKDLCNIGKVPYPKRELTIVEALMRPLMKTNAYSKLRNYGFEIDEELKCTRIELPASEFGTFAGFDENFVD